MEMKQLGPITMAQKKLNNAYNKQPTKLRRSTKRYTDFDYKTKKELKADLAAGKRITIYAPGLGSPNYNGTEYLEGPHYPKPHSWYAQVEMKNGIIIKVK